MPHISFEELVQTSGVAPATLNRRLAYIKKNDAQVYKNLYKKEGRTKYYDAGRLLPILADWGGYVGRLEQAEAPPVLKKKDRTREAPPHRAHTVHAAPPKDTARDEKLTQLLETPVVILQPDQASLDLFNRIRDPHLKQRVEYAIRICATYSRGDVTLEDACLENDIPARTFRDWTHNHAEVATLYKRARAKHRRARAQLVAEVAHDALFALVEGEEYEEVTTTYKNRLEPDGTVTQIPIGVKRTMKRTGRSAVATIFALTNAMPKLYQNKLLAPTGVPADQQTKDDIDRMSPEQRLERLQAIMGEQAKQKLIDAGWTPPTPLTDEA